MLWKEKKGKQNENSTNVIWFVTACVYEMHTLNNGFSPITSMTCDDGKHTHTQQQNSNFIYLLVMWMFLANDLHMQSIIYITFSVNGLGTVDANRMRECHRSAHSGFRLRPPHFPTATHSPKGEQTLMWCTEHAWPALYPNGRVIVFVNGNIVNDEEHFGTERKQQH